MEVKIQSVPWHIRVEGNKQADRGVKEAVGSTGIKRGADRFTSVAHVDRTTIEIQWKEDKHWFKTKHEAIPPM